MASWSSSGMPSSMPMTRIGISAARSWMKSKCPVPTRGSSVRAQKRRTSGSMAVIALGVKTRLKRLRCSSWAGGSSNRIEPGGISIPLLISSRTDPFPEM